MTQNDLKLAVISANNTLATNNPKGLTDALRGAGYVQDGRFDIMGYDALNKALLELYLTDSNKWAQIMKSVPFNYQKTDSSNSPETRAKFQNIATAINPELANAKIKLPSWFGNVLDLIVGSTTTTTTGYAPTQLKAKVSPWVYGSLIILGLAIIVLVVIVFKQKSI